MEKKKRVLVDRNDFYKSKYEYYAFYCQAVVVVASICSVFYYVSDCQLFGYIALDTLIPRCFILLPLIGYLFLVRTKVSYKWIILASYGMLHLIMWDTIWAIIYLPDKTHASEGFIIMQVMFLAIGFFSPAWVSTIMHGLIIGNILVSNLFNHYSNLDLMLSLGIPCAVGICTVYYVSEKLFLRHYLTTQKLQEYSLYDSLTAAYNRNLMSSLIDEDQIHFQENLGKKVALMMFDIDFFKRVNDLYGHSRGDKILKWICSVVKENIDNGYLIRWGGEEFLIILPGLSLDETIMKAEKIRNLIETEADPECPVTISIGVDMYNLDDVKKSNYKEIIDNADQALYLAKRNGRNRVEVYDKQKIDPMYLVGNENYLGKQSELDKSGLEDRIFDVFAATSRTQYIYLCNMKTNVSRWSQYAVDYFGLPDQYIFNAGELWTEYIHPDDRLYYQKDIQALFAGEKSVHDLEYRVRNKEGNYILCTCRGIVMKGEHGEPDYFAGTMVNHGMIDLVDPITNLYNTYEFLNTIRQRILNRIHISILTVGIMHFSDVNEAHGYVAGDRILLLFANKLTEQFSGSALIFREDGVKFAMIFKGFKLDQIIAAYKKVQDIAFHQIYLDGLHIPLSVAGGYVDMKNFSGSEYTVRAGVAYAVQVSKQESFGKLISFDENLHTKDLSHIDMMNEIENSILNQCSGFHMLYQPVVRVQDNRISGVEALIRWTSKTGEVIPPNRFIGWLEMEPCFYQLGNWILEHSMMEILPILRRNPDFILSINIAYSQLQHTNFREDFIEILNRTQFPRKNLCLEITERCAKMDLKMLKDLLIFLRNLGITIALDDFGTGFSSFELLRELPVDEIKIDRSYIVSIQENKKERDLVRSIIECADRIGCVSCIEGVENKELHEYLCTFGATYHQGYYYARPVPFNRLETYLPM